MIFEFDVGITSHDGLKNGITVEYWTLVRIEAESFWEASLGACQMSFGHDRYVSDLLWRNPDLDLEPDTVLTDSYYLGHCE